MGQRPPGPYYPPQGPYYPPPRPPQPQYRPQRPYHPPQLPPPKKGGAGKAILITLGFCALFVAVFGGLAAISLNSPVNMTAVAVAATTAAVPTVDLTAVGGTRVAAAQTAVALTSTAEPSRTPIPPTLTAAQARAKYDANYPIVDMRVIAKNPDAYQGTKVKLTGEVFAIQESNGQTVFQMWADDPGGSQFNREAVAVRLGITIASLVKGSRVVVYGTVLGTVNGTNAFGGAVSQPVVNTDHILYS